MTQAAALECPAMPVEYDPGIVEIRFTEKLPLSFSTQVHGRILLDRFLSRYLNLHSELDKPLDFGPQIFDQSKRPTIGHCLELIKGISSPNADFELSERPVSFYEHQLIIYPELSIMAYKSKPNGESNSSFANTLVKTFSRLRYTVMPLEDFTNCEKHLPRYDTRGVIRNP